MPTRPLLIKRTIFATSRRSSLLSSHSERLLRFRNYVRPYPWHLKVLGWRAHRRAASTIPSVTAVNAQREIPAAFKELHSSLESLQQDAVIYVNSSQLQLALKGLGSEDPVTRIAVLGLNGSSGTRRLTRALLADPLAEEQTWEKQLLRDEESDERAILLRYGEKSGVDEKHPLVRTFSIPSPTLHTHNLEILIHTANSAINSSDDFVASLLVPGLDIKSSSSGKLSTVTYPVHKALIYGEGIKDLSTFATVEAFSDQHEEGRILHGVLDSSWNIAQHAANTDQPVSPINLALAETAIDAFRESPDNSFKYEHMWYGAGMPALSAWLVEGEGPPGSVKPVVRRLIKNLCKDARKAIKEDAAASLRQMKDVTVPDMTKRVMEQAISIWAQMAHTELRDRLDSAFDSQSWRKIKWWKLIWRVDEVSYTTLDVLKRAWLVESEKEMIWICGRIYQSGLLGPPRLNLALASDLENERPKLGSVPFAPDAADVGSQTPTFDEPPPFRHPWLQDISRARSALANLTVPPLQALSQTLLLQTLSTTVLASSFAALIYVSVSTTSPYEAGAIAATGLIFALRRLQTRWETARKEWEKKIREEGRRILRSTEDVLREGAEGFKPKVDEVDLEERASATKAVEYVEEVLRGLQK